MKKLAMAILFLSTPVMAQTVAQPQANTIGDPTLRGGVSNPLPGAVAPAGVWDGKVRCKPIGKTLSGELVFAVNCKDVPKGFTDKGKPPMAPESMKVKEK
jgi:hypothetical protein